MAKQNIVAVPLGLKGPSWAKKGFYAIPTVSNIIQETVQETVVVNVAEKHKPKPFNNVVLPKDEPIQVVAKAPDHVIVNDDMDISPTGAIKSPNDIKLINRVRFTSGNDALDYIYGDTIFRWTEDAPNSKYSSHGVWESGDYKCGDMMPEVIQPYFMAGDGNWKGTLQNVKRQSGMPEAFLSLWGGSPGVGKSKLAIALSKSLNIYGNRVLYFNGELDESDFRIMLGSNIDGDLFSLVSEEQAQLDDAIAQIYAVKPRVVVFDSIQMLENSDGIKDTLHQLKKLKNDPNAGRPHIILISQLNKKDQLFGPRVIEHLVDFAATVTKVKERKGMFLFECLRKNRAGETPRGRYFQHHETGVEAVYGEVPEYD